MGILYCKVAGNVVRVRREILVPVIFTLTVIGAYACNRSWFDVKVMFIVGFLGYLLGPTVMELIRKNRKEKSA